MNSHDDRSYVRFNRIILGLSGIFAGSLFALMSYMDPLVGNLTRMGGYLENDYGWNAPQQMFPKPLFKIAESVDDYDRHFDVVVVGDSFSQNRINGWQNYFVDATGLSVITLHLAQTPIDQIFSNEVFKEHPPRLFVYESIERNLLSRHPTCDTTPEIETQVPPPAHIQVHAQQTGIGWTDRSQRPAYPGWTRFDAAINFLRKSASREILGINRTETRRFRLSQSDLFSNRRSESLLIILRDYRLAGASDSQIQTVSCSLLRLQHRVQSNSHTRFVALLFPDKTTAYSDYIVDDDYVPMTVLGRIEGIEALQTARLGQAIQRAIRGGAVDVFLPNDEHCGFLGYKIAADSVVTAARAPHPSP